MKKIRTELGKCIELEFKHKTQCHRLMDLIKPLIEVSTDEKEHMVIILDVKMGYLIRTTCCYYLNKVLLEIEANGKVSKEQFEKCRV